MSKDIEAGAPINPVEKKRDNTLLIIVIVLLVLFFFVLPLTIVALVFFGVLKPLFDSGIEYINQSNYGNSVKPIYSRSIEKIYTAYKSDSPIERGDCLSLQEFVEDEADAAVDLCSGGSLTLAASKAGDRVDMVAFSESRYILMTFDTDFTKFYKIARVTQLSEDPDGVIKQLEIISNNIIPEPVIDCDDDGLTDCGVNTEGLDGDTNGTGGANNSANSVNVQVLRVINHI